jgi:hypothetical protein
MTTPPAGGPGRRGRFDRLPASAVFLITAVLSFAVSTGVRLLDQGVDSTYLITRGVGSLVLAGLFTWRFTRTRRNAGGADGVVSLRESLRTGGLPEHVDRDGWEAELTRRERVLRRNRWFAPLFFGALAVFGAWAILAVPRAAPAGWLLLVLGLALGAVVVVRTAQLLPRIRSLLEQLEARP